MLHPSREILQFMNLIKKKCPLMNNGHIKCCLVYELGNLLVIRKILRKCNAMAHLYYLDVLVTFVL